MLKQVTLLITTNIGTILYNAPTFAQAGHNKNRENRNKNENQPNNAKERNGNQNRR